MAADPFLKALGPVEDLPEAVSQLHMTDGRFSGQCDIVRGAGILASFATRLAGFPPNGHDVPVSVTISAEGEALCWQRDFGGHCTTSHLTYDAKRNCVREDFGAISIWLQPNLQNGSLNIKILRLTVLGIPMPTFALPRSDTREWQDALGRFRFDVSAEAPGLGLLIRYQGWLTLDHAMHEAG